MLKVDEQGIPKIIQEIYPIYFGFEIKRGRRVPIESLHEMAFKVWYFDGSTQHILGTDCPNYLSKYIGTSYWWQDIEKYLETLYLKKRG